MNAWLKRALRAWIVFLVSAVVGSIAWALASKRSFVPVVGPEDDEIAIGSFFEPLQFSSTAAHFRGGSIACGFGGGLIDLSEATLDPAGAALRISCAFGGAQLTIPASWPVDVKVFPVFGGVGDARRGSARVDGGPRLTITGWTLFGGLGIVPAEPRAESVDV